MDTNTYRKRCREENDIACSRTRNENYCRDDSDIQSLKMSFTVIEKNLRADLKKSTEQNEAFEQQIKQWEDLVISLVDVMVTKAPSCIPEFMRVCNGSPLYKYEELNLRNTVDKMLALNNSTRHLVELCSSANPDCQAVQSLVKQGANVCWVSDTHIYPAIFECVQRGLVSCFEECLKTKQKIDFCVAYTYGFTLLHFICEIEDEMKAQKMMELVVFRIETHPLDSINWFQKDIYGSDFLSCAAEKGRLSLFWPVVQNAAKISDVIQIPLTKEVYSEDWEKLGCKNHEYFYKPRLRVSSSILPSKKDSSLVSYTFVCVFYAMKRSLRKRLLAIPEDSFEDTFREFLDVCPTDNLTKSEPIRQFSSPPPPESTPRSRLRDTKPKPGSRRIFTEMEKQIIFSRVEQTEQLDEEERQNRLSLVRQRNKDEYIEAVKKRSSLLAEKVLETKLESVIDSEKRRNDILFRSQNVLLLRRLRSFIERSELWYTIVVSHMFLTNIIQVQKEQQALEKLSFLFRPLVHRYISLKRIAVEQEEFIRHLPNIPYPTPEVIQCMEGQFFRGWAPFLLESLTSKAQLKVVKQGKFLLHAGNVDRTMYMVTYGTVSILLRKRGDTCKRRTKENSLNLLSMDAPCYVGEFGLVCKERRTASVYCETDIVAWGISPTHYSQVAKYLDMDLGQKQKAVADERRKQNLRNLFPLRMDILIKNPYFKFFSENSLQRIIMSANPLVLHDGESLFERGELKSSAYIIQDGSVLEIDESGSSVPIAMGDLLGIFECVCGVNEKKKTSVVCVGDCDIWELTRDLLVDVGLTEPYAFIECRKVAKEARAKLINKENTAPEFFRSDAYLSFCFLPVHLLKIYRASTPVVFINGEIIIQLGTPVTGFLTLLEGTVDVTYFYKSSRETFRMSTKDILGELKEGSGEEAKSADKVKKKKGDSVWARGIHGHTLVFGVYEYATSLAEYACTIKSHGITEALFSDIRHVKLYTPPELQRIMKENSTGQQLVKRAYQEQKLSLLTSSKSSFAHLYKELKSKTEK